MNNYLLEGFHWLTLDGYENHSAEEQYQLLVDWSKKARQQNPTAFDAVSDWMLDDDNWTADHFETNRIFFMDTLLPRFQNQSAVLRECLSALLPSGLVNSPVFKALDQLDAELSGHTAFLELQPFINQVFHDFSAMQDPAVRKHIAGCQTGPTGTNSVELFGYINYLKECDAAVQWALFMPETVKQQQNGFQLKSFEYKTLPAFCFIGRDDSEDPSETFQILDTLSAFQSAFSHDLLFIHHNGQGVDTEPCHLFWGRFMQMDTPVPEGFTSIDFLPERTYSVGAPYLSQFAYAVFSGDETAMHQRDGFDSDAMYDITRNTMLAQGVTIPYPDKYWTAEVFLNGYKNSSTAYLFSAEL